MATVTDTDTIDAATGKARPLSEQEQKTKSEALARALAEIAEMSDETDTDEIWADVFRGIDESRPHCPLFEGRYIPTINDGLAIAATTTRIRR